MTLAGITWKFSAFAALLAVISCKSTEESETKDILGVSQGSFESATADVDATWQVTFRSGGIAGPTAEVRKTVNSEVSTFRAPCTGSGVWTCKNQTLNLSFSLAQKTAKLTTTDSNKTIDFTCKVPAQSPNSTLGPWASVCDSINDEFSPGTNDVAPSSRPNLELVMGSEPGVRSYVWVKDDDVNGHLFCSSQGDVWTCEKGGDVVRYKQSTQQALLILGDTNETFRFTCKKETPPADFPAGSFRARCKQN